MDTQTSGNGSDVYLNVYDLVEQNNWAHWAGMGVYHSGVEVYGVEYAFGGHDYDAPGVFATHPRGAPGTVAWREAILVGRTNLSPTQVYELVQEMGGQYKGNRYHLLQMNCNSFSKDLCARLTGNETPGWVNRLANLAVSLHCLLPPGWVPPLRPPTALMAAEHMPGPQGDDERSVLLEADHRLAASSSSGALANGGSVGSNMRNQAFSPTASSKSLEKLPLPAPPATI